MPVRHLATLFNGYVAAIGATWRPTADSKIIAFNKSALVTTLSAQIQGSVDEGLTWINIGSAVSTESAVLNTDPWPLIRVNVGTHTVTVKTADSVTQTAGIATFTEVAHGMAVGDIITVAGANQAGYNGVKQILTVDTADVFTYAVASDTVTPATGTVTATVHTVITGGNS